MEEISSMTKQNADNAGQADSLMKSALGVIKTADTSMSEMNSSMEEISLASVETSKIIKTIDEIAFQTNLLALNAAVEAARAGEAGAGFAVVADEVRNLAMRAAEAAKTTSHLIEETVQKVMKGKKIVVKANEAFKEVAESSAKVGALIDEIATASQEQAHGFGQINKAIVEMDSVTQQNSATAEESAAASEELNAQAETIMDMLRGLKSILDGDVKKPLRKRSNVVMNKAIRPKSTPRTPLLAIPKNPPKKKSAKPKDPSPEEIIPMDHDDEFEDF
jgi:methyl-accepting chemotaxis protein